ncbi:MAG: hypothetical protein FWG54_03350 [Bacteroidetes bacterium]|nr:hypothetical protein [Bacteroidota bacterium]
MTNSVLEFIANETNGKCYQSFRYCADDDLKMPTLDYEDKGSEFSLVKNSCGETDTGLRATKSIKETATKIINNEPLFHFFLDGSRRTYKVDDIEINRNVYPVIAGQIGVACCQRLSPDKFGNAAFEGKLVLSLPNIANSEPGIKAELFFNRLKDKVNTLSTLKKRGIRFEKILSYNSKKQDDGAKYEHLGIATIQDEMIETEKKIVASLYDKGLINANKYLIKDGSLQYKPMKTGDFKELIKIKNPLPCGIIEMYEGEDKIKIPVNFKSFTKFWKCPKHLFCIAFSLSGWEKRKNIKSQQMPGGNAGAKHLQR